MTTCRTSGRLRAGERGSALVESRSVLFDWYHTTRRPLRPYPSTRPRLDRSILVRVKAAQAPRRHCRPGKALLAFVVLHLEPDHPRHALAFLRLGIYQSGRAQHQAQQGGCRRPHFRGVTGEITSAWRFDPPLARACAACGRACVFRIAVGGTLTTIAHRPLDHVSPCICLL